MSYVRLSLIFVFAVVVLGASAACKGDAQSQPAREAAEQFLDALKYGDWSSAAKLHVDASSAGFYCESDGFRRVLERARQERTADECDQLDSLGAAQLEGLDAQERLAAQIVRFVCESPEGTCGDYGRRVAQSYLRAPHASAWKVASWKIQRVVGGDGEVIVYADLTLEPEAGEESEARRSIAMKRVDGRWYVAEPLDAAPAASTQ